MIAFQIVSVSLPTETDVEETCGWCGGQLLKKIAHGLFTKIKHLLSVHFVHSVFHLNLI
jgi:hypothetical protein